MLISMPFISSLCNGSSAMLHSFALLLCWLALISNSLRVLEACQCGDLGCPFPSLPLG